MDTSPMLSVVIATFNQQEYILRCLESLKCDNTSVMELIVVDDCSTDKTFDLATQWISKNGFAFYAIIAIRNNKNMGVSYTYTTGARQAHGTYVHWMGGDDLHMPNSFSEILSRVSISHAPVFSSSVLEFVETNGKRNFIRNIPPWLSRGFFFFPAWLQFRFVLLKGSPLYCGCQMFIAKNLLESVGFFGVEYKSFEDIQTYLRILRGGQKIAFINVAVSLWRRHQQSISTRAYTRSEMFIEDHRRIYAEFCYGMKNRAVQYILKKYYLENHKRYIYFSIPWLLFHALPNLLSLKALAKLRKSIT